MESDPRSGHGQRLSQAGDKKKKKCVSLFFLKTLKYITCLSYEKHL